MIQVELKTIYEPIQPELQQVEQNLGAAIDEDIPILSELLDYVVRDGGKRIRPALTLFAGKFYHYDLDLLLPAATAMEFLHTATLVHDDIVDGSAKRRGKPTVNSVWGNTNAVLFGDYLFAKAANLMTSAGNIRVMNLMSQAAAIIACSELRHNAVPQDMERAREYYYEWIGNKTAVLFSVAAELGAILSRAPEEAIQALKNYGYNFGMLFQITDDILDFIGDEAQLGKPLGSDLSRGILTLPTILLLERWPGDEVVKKALGSSNDDDIASAIDKVRNSFAVRDSFDAAFGFYSSACQSLKDLPDKRLCTHLVELANYAIQRKW